MSIFKTFVVTAVAAGALVAAVAPASAEITTIASFSPTSSTKNIAWKNSAADGQSGTGGTIFSTKADGTVGSNLGQFSFFVPWLAPYITNVTARFSLFGTSPAGNPALLTTDALGNQYLTQPNISGSFSFTSTSDITIGATVFGAGSILLSAVSYDGALIVGKRGGTAAGFAGSDPANGTIVYYSDFIDLSTTTYRDFAYSLAAINPVYDAFPFTTAVPTKALRSFRASSGGTFSADIPEPQTWALLVAGFALVGFQIRRRSAAVAA